MRAWDAVFYVEGTSCLPPLPEGELNFLWDKIGRKLDVEQLHRTLTKKNEMLSSVHLLAAVLLTVVSASKPRDWDEAMVRPCPQLRPHPEIEMDKVSGDWYLKLLVVEDSVEDFEEGEGCLKVGLALSEDGSQLTQSWLLSHTPAAAALQINSTLLKPGVWVAKTPFGGQVKAVVFGYKEDDYALVVHCGWFKGHLIHLWTAGVTREPVLTPQNLLMFNILLKENGFDSPTTKIITWDTC